jgi:Na+/melibiose symporter-like transporter
MTTDLDDVAVRQHSRFFMSAGMAVLLLFSLLIYALSWMMGGNDQLDHMGGQAGLTIVVVALAVSAISAFVNKPKT